MAVSRTFVQQVHWACFLATSAKHSGWHWDRKSFLKWHWKNLTWFTLQFHGWQHHQEYPQVWIKWTKNSLKADRVLHIKTDQSHTGSLLRILEQDSPLGHRMTQDSQRAVRMKLAATLILTRWPDARLCRPHLKLPRLKAFEIEALTPVLLPTV